MLSVNRVTRYQAYDGELFETYEEAEAHNKELIENAAIPFDDFCAYDENGRPIRSDDSNLSYEDMCFFYAKTEVGAKFLEMYLAAYANCKITIEPKMLYRYNIYKCEWVSQKKCLDDFNSLWKGLITFEESHC